MDASYILHQHRQLRRPPGLHGAMRYFQHLVANRTYVDGDTDGAGAADFRLELSGVQALTTADIVL